MRKGGMVGGRELGEGGREGEGGQQEQGKERN